MADRVLPAGRVTLPLHRHRGLDALLEELGAEGYVEALAEHRALLREAFGATAASRSIRRAMPSSVAFGDAPRRCCGRGEATSARRQARSSVRMGLHTGDAASDAARATSAGTSTWAARIAAAGHGGQVLRLKADAASWSRTS